MLCQLQFSVLPLQPHLLPDLGHEGVQIGLGAVVRFLYSAERFPCAQPGHAAILNVADGGSGNANQAGQLLLGEPGPLAEGDEPPAIVPVVLDSVAPVEEYIVESPLHLIVSARHRDRPWQQESVHLYRRSLL